MSALTTEAALNIFDNDEDNTDSAALLPHIEQARNDVHDLRHLRLLQHPRSE